MPTTTTGSSSDPATTSSTGTNAATNSRRSPATVPTAPTNEGTNTATAPTPSAPTVEEIEGVVPTSRPNLYRTANAFDDEEDLRMALTNMEITSSSHRRGHGGDERRDGQEREESDGRQGDCDGDGNNDCDDMDASQENATNSTSYDDTMEDPTWDWTCPNYDPQRSMPPSIASEAKRLMNLKSFGFMLGSQEKEHGKERELERDGVFQCVALLAQRVLKAPICTINFLDIGRAWMIAGVGVGDIQESPRKVSWCNHTIRYISDEHCMVVEDATQDWRFNTTEYVTGPLHLRYYAGAPLVSPEGFRLGTICVMGFEARTFTPEDRASLVDLARIVMGHLVEKRSMALVEQSLKQALQRQQQLAVATTDCLIPLQAARNSLQLLQRNGTQPQERALHAAVVAAQVTQDILQDATQPRPLHNNKTSANTTTMDTIDTTGDTTATTNVHDFVYKLHTLVDPIPKRVPVVLSVQTELRTRNSLVGIPELPLLRACLALLSQACAATTTPGGRIQLHMRLQHLPQQPQQVLVVECQETRSCSSPTQIQQMKMMMESIQVHVQPLGGQCGFQQPNSSTINGPSKTHVVWFSIAIVGAKTTQASSPATPDLVRCPLWHEVDQRVHDVGNSTAEREEDTRNDDERRTRVPRMVSQDAAATTPATTTSALPSRRRLRNEELVETTAGLIKVEEDNDDPGNSNEHTPQEGEPRPKRIRLLTTNELVALPNLL